MKKWILDHLPTIWVCAIYAFGMIMVIDHARADWIMKKPITYKEESKVNSAPVSDVYINEISKKVEDKLKLIEENEKKGILKSTTLDRFERDGQWCFIKIVIRQKGDDIIKEEIMDCADTEHGRTDKEKIAERFVVDNTANDFAVILSENQQKVCNEIRQNNFDFIN